MYETSKRVRDNAGITAAFGGFLGEKISAGKRGVCSVFPLELRENDLRDRIAGFTLIELLITVAVISIVTTTGIIWLFDYYNRQNLNLTADEIVSLIRDAQSRSLTQENGSVWGVRFNNAASTNFQLFQGSVFSSSSIVVSRDLRPGIKFLFPVVGSSTDIIFSKITGYPNVSTTIVMALVRNPSQASSTINVNAVGRVSRF